MAEDKESTHPDSFQAELELNFMLTNSQCKVLNAGCGAGYETKRCSEVAESAVGVDFSENMINLAQKHKSTKATFRVQDILDLSSIIDEFGKFDTVTTRRTLINLLSWEDQKKAIMEFKKCLNVGGKLILIEGLEEGYDELNNLRGQVGLDNVEIVDYNLSLSMKKLDDFMTKNNWSLLNSGDISLYYYLTRVFYPKLNEPEYNSKFAKIAYELQTIQSPKLFTCPILMRVYEVI